MFDKLERLLSLVRRRINARHRGGPIQFVILGDYFDRGPDSRAVMDCVRELQSSGAICLRGNHEELLIQSSESDRDMRAFLRNGGDQTLASLGTSDGIRDAIDWAASLPHAYEDELRYFVHAGTMPGVPLNEQRPEDQLWIRAPFLGHGELYSKYVVHGHSATIRQPGQSRKVHVLSNRCNVDTGAVYGGPLSAVIFAASRRLPIDVVSTDDA